MEIKPGVVLNYKNGFDILVNWTKIIGDKPWVYVTNRKYSYSVDPTDYKYMEKVPSLKGIAVVAEDVLSQKNAELERNFFNKPFEIFETVEDAFLWAEEQILR